MPDQGRGRGGSISCSNKALKRASREHVGTDRSPEKRARQAQLGCAPAHRLVENGRVLTVRRGDGARPPRSFEDYEVAVDLGRMPGGVELTDIRC